VPVTPVGKDGRVLPLPRCAQASLAVDNDPAGSSSSFRSFLLITDPGGWGKKAGDDAVREQLDPFAAQWVESNRAGLRAFAIRPVGSRRAANRRGFLAGRVEAAGGITAFAEAPSAAELESVVTGTASGDPIDGPLIAVCTNGTRDRCCALLGRPIARRLAAELGGDRVTEISHLGGHRFAGTLVVLPWGYSYGFLDPDSAARIADDAARGLVHPRQLRGRADLSPAAQAAEIAWRRELGPAAPDAVVVTDEHTEGAGSLVTGLVGGRTESLKMRYLPGPTIDGTACGGKPFGTGRWFAELG